MLIGPNTRMFPVEHFSVLHKCSPWNIMTNLVKPHTDVPVDNYDQTFPGEHLNKRFPWNIVQSSSQNTPMHF
jgi:hypothetical protein